MLIIWFMVGGCSTIVTSDSILYIVGKVTDESGLGINDVVVNLGLLQTVTDEDGCFEFDGLYSAIPARINISKIGYVTIEEEKPFSGYFIKATIIKINSSKVSRLVWTELDISDPNLYVGCEGENLDRFAK